MQGRPCTCKHYRRTSSDPSAKAQRTQTYTNYKERAGGRSKSRRCQPASTAIQAVQSVSYYRVTGYGCQPFYLLSITGLAS